MADTRMLLEKSWGLARRRADAEGVVRLNAASCAGQYLAIADGDAQRAIGMVPTNDSAFWTRVGKLLAEVVTEDAAARGPRLTGTGS